VVITVSYVRFRDQQKPHFTLWAVDLPEVFDLEHMVEWLNVVAQARIVQRSTRF
jgi:hypothetical protein